MKSFTIGRRLAWVPNPKKSANVNISKSKSSIYRQKDNYKRNERRRRCKKFVSKLTKAWAKVWNKKPFVTSMKDIDSQNQLQFTMLIPILAKSQLRNEIYQSKESRILWRKISQLLASQSTDFMARLCQLSFKSVIQKSNLVCRKQRQKLEINNQDRHRFKKQYHGGANKTHTLSSPNMSAVGR